jgi:hypothetical protein
MTSPGEAMLEKSATSQRYLSKLEKAELLNYRKLIQGIADDDRLAFVDEMLPGYTPKGKLLEIDKALENK